MSTMFKYFNVAANCFLISRAEINDNMPELVFEPSHYTRVYCQEHADWLIEEAIKTTEEEYEEYLKDIEEMSYTPTPLQYSLEEAIAQLKEDRDKIAQVVWEYINGEDDDDGNENEEPKDLYIIDHPLMGGKWESPATVAEIKEYVDINLKNSGLWVEWRTTGSPDSTAYPMWRRVQLFSREERDGWKPYRAYEEVEEGVWDNVILFRTDVGVWIEPKEDETDTLEQADLSSYDSYLEEDEETSDEAHLGESTLAKIRRQKELLLEDDRPEVPAEKAVTRFAKPVEGFFICTKSVEGRGTTPNDMIYAFSCVEDFLSQNPDWAEVVIPPPCWHGVTIKNSTLPIRGGFQLAWGGWHDCVIYSPHIYRP